MEDIISEHLFGQRLFSIDIDTILYTLKVELVIKGI
jgi:hypothetical protein